MIQPVAYVKAAVRAQAPTPTDTPAPVTNIQRTITYNYDSLYRVTSAQDSNGDNRSYSYAYAFNGDRLSARAFDGTHTTFDTYHYNLLNQLSSITSNAVDRTFQYDDNGNLTNDGLNAYTYDGENRLLTANNATYVYNGLGDRVRQTVGSVNTNYLLDMTAENTQVLSEYTGQQQTNYLYGLDMLGQQQGNDWSYFGADGLGSTRMLTDGTGAVTRQASYDPYGIQFEQYGPTTANFGYTGEQSDPSGLTYLRARYYDPQLGTFLSRDSFEGVSDYSGSRNGYSYTQGNPVNYADPSGQCIGPAIIVCVAAIVAGVTYIADWASKVHSNQAKGMSFWEAVSYDNNKPCPACEVGLSVLVPHMGDVFLARNVIYSASTGQPFIPDVQSFALGTSLHEVQPGAASPGVADGMKTIDVQGQIIDDGELSSPGALTSDNGSLVTTADPLALPSGMSEDSAIAPAGLDAQLALASLTDESGPTQADWERLISSSSLRTDASGRIRPNRRDDTDPGVSLRKRRAWFAGDETSDVSSRLGWKTGRPDKEVPAIYEFQDQVLKEKLGLDKLYVGSTDQMRTRMGDHMGVRLRTYDGIRYYQLPDNITPRDLKILEQIRILQYGGVDNLANSYRSNGRRYTSNPINLKNPLNRDDIRKFAESNLYGLPDELLELPPGF